MDTDEGRTSRFVCVVVLRVFVSVSALTGHTLTRPEAVPLSDRPGPKMQLGSCCCARQHARTHARTLPVWPGPSPPRGPALPSLCTRPLARSPALATCAVSDSYDSSSGREPTANTPTGGEQGCASHWILVSTLRRVRHTHGHTHSRQINF